MSSRLQLFGGGLAFWVNGWEWYHVWDMTMKRVWSYLTRCGQRYDKMNIESESRSTLMPQVKEGVPTLST